MRFRVLSAARTVGVSAAGLLALGLATAAPAAAVATPTTAVGPHGRAAEPHRGGPKTAFLGNSEYPAPGSLTTAAGDDSTDTVLAATAGASALVSMACLAMHIRVRRAAKSRSSEAVSAPLTMPLETAGSQPAMSQALWLQDNDPPQEPSKPPQNPLSAPPPPPNHNALDSVWSISAAVHEDPVVDDTAADHPAVTTDTGAPNSDVTMADPPPAPSWRPPRDS
ncbi:hypothetical protein [Yinghuangia sp. YIM S10712]|uniref:hypothetical protein n=1 Tax=Yinghuangia sp. YIM S10712 TaxID=3436930 RepID=UPI003F53BCC9